MPTYGYPFTKTLNFTSGSLSGARFTSSRPCVSGRTHWKRIDVVHYLDNWLVIAELVSLLLQHSKQLFWLCIVTNWEKSNLEPSNRFQYHGMLIHTIRERVFLTNSRIVRFWDLVNKFSLSPSPADVAAAFRLHGVPGVFYS